METPTHCDGCGLSFNYYIDYDFDGNEVINPIIALSNGYGDFCEECAKEKE